MKTGSDNFRDSAVLDIIKLIKQNGIEVILYEPLLNKSEYNGIKIIKK